MSNKRPALNEAILSPNVVPDTVTAAYDVPLSSTVTSPASSVVI